MKIVRNRKRRRCFMRLLLQGLMMLPVALAILFLASPYALKVPCIFDSVAVFFEPLKNEEYRGAFIGACGGMIGSFLAITGALWVERRLAKDKDQKEIEKIALILYYDIKLFYKDVCPLAANIANILNCQFDIKKKYTLFKNNIGIHIHPDWISLVASLKEELRSDEIEQIYLFYGNVSDMKSAIEAEHLEFSRMGRVNNIINTLGTKSGDKYLPNEDYQSILARLKDIAKYEETEIEMVRISFGSR